MNSKKLGSIGTLNWYKTDSYSFNVYLTDFDSNNGRYIEFDNNDSRDFGLVMSGNTPVSWINPKRNEIEIPFMDGTMDVSNKRTATTNSYYGNLFFEKRQLVYNFVLLIPSEIEGYTYVGNIIPNQNAEIQLEKIRDWLGLSMTRGSDKTSSYFYDSALLEYGLHYSNAKCISMKPTKLAMSPEFWIYGIEIIFDVDPFIDNIETHILQRATPINIEGTFRDIRFNGEYARGKGLIMAENTPVIYPDPKSVHISTSMMDGYINNDSPLGFRFFNDLTIEYTFKAAFEKDTTTSRMNGAIQIYIEWLHNWFFDVPGSRTWTPRIILPSITMFNTSNMYDDALAGYYYEFVRCSSVSYEKEVIGNTWILTVTPTFKAYPLLRQISGVR